MMREKESFGAQLFLKIIPEHAGQDNQKISFKWVLEGSWSKLEVRRVHRKVALEHGSKPTKYELEGPYGDLGYELLGTRSGRDNYQGSPGTLCGKYAGNYMKYDV